MCQLVCECVWGGGVVGVVGADDSYTSLLLCFSSHAAQTPLRHVHVHVHVHTCGTTCSATYMHVVLHATHANAICMHACMYMYNNIAAGDWPGLFL